MISYIRGRIAHAGGGAVIIENNGVGYRVQVSPATVSGLPRDKETTLYTHMNVREDGISLFGFLSNEELELFGRLIGVSGIGPKAGLSMLGAMSPAEILLAIIGGDAKALSQAPGIGKKTAERLILELRDKLGKLEGYAGAAERTAAGEPSLGAKADALDALLVLGYSRAEAARALSDDEGTAEELLRAALKKLTRL